MAIKQQIKFKDEINFEADQQDAMKKTEGIQSLADQVERLETVHTNIESAEQILKDFKEDDYLLLTGDPALIGVACSIVSDITNGKYNLLKWDKQERKYYPISINLYEKGEINDN